MKTAFVLALVILLASHQMVFSQGPISWTPVIDTGLVKTTITVPPQFAALQLDPSRHYVYVPQGWTASVYYAGRDLDKPRFLEWGPDSVLYVANMSDNNVLALPDRNRDGIADEAVIATQTASNCGDVKFYRDTMYTCQERGVVRQWRTDPNSLVYDQGEVVVDKSQQANQMGGNHKTRTLVLDTNAMQMFVSVGSRGNADRESDRATIERYDWDGTDRRIYARGVRNAVGMTLHPRTGAVWANNNGSDLQGDNVPPEWVDIVREGGFYGYPVAYHDRNWMDFSRPGYGDLLPITADDSADVASMVRPAALVWAHCAPMEMEWSHSNMPERWRNGLFMVMRGSWNRTPISGGKVVFFTFDGDEDTVANEMHEFCTGFITDSTRSGTRWARPVGIALAGDGSVYVTSDDIHEFVLKLTPPTPVSVKEWGQRSNNALQLRVYPNPSNSVVKIQSTISGGYMRVLDVSGRVLLQGQMEGTDIMIDAAQFPSSTVLIRVDGKDHYETATISISH